MLQWAGKLALICFHFISAPWKCIVSVWPTVPHINKIYVYPLGWFDWHWGKHPRWQSSWDQHGAHLGPVGPRWAPCGPHEPCYEGYDCPSDSEVTLAKPRLSVCLNPMYLTWFELEWWYPILTNQLAFSGRQVANHPTQTSLRMQHNVVILAR